MPVTAGVCLPDTDKVSFPSGTDLSGIDLASHPEQYYAYVYRSLNSNNGFYKIVQVDDDNDNAYDYVRVEDADFVQESGAAGDISMLTASVGRPVVYKKYSDDHENEKGRPGLRKRARSLHHALHRRLHRRLPRQSRRLQHRRWHRRQKGPGGIAIQCSSHNVYANGKVYDTDIAIGCIIDGNQDHPATYNFVMNYEIYDVIGEGIYIGAGYKVEYYNQPHCNHIVGNEIHMSGATDELENAVDVKEYNQGNVIERNTIRHFRLMSQANGAIEIRDRPHFTLVYNNILKDIVGSDSSGDTEYVFNVYPDTQNVWIFNNLIYRTAASQDYVYAVNLEGNSTSGNLSAHNTIRNMDLGILLQNYNWRSFVRGTSLECAGSAVFHGGAVNCAFGFLTDKASDFAPQWKTLSGIGSSAPPWKTALPVFSNFSAISVNPVRTGLKSFSQSLPASFARGTKAFSNANPTAAPTPH